MGRKLIAFGWIMRSPQPVEPREVGRRDLRGDNQRAGH